MTQQRPDERRAAELSRLMAAYEKDILKLCCLYLRDAGMAEDAAQETFFKAYRALDRFRGECADKTWLVRILINECKGVLRTRGRCVPLEQDADEAAPETDGELYAALAALDEKYRLPVTLHYIEGFRTSEIAGMMRLPEGTVKTRLRRAREILRKELEGACYA